MRCSSRSIVIGIVASAASAFILYGASATLWQDDEPQDSEAQEIDAREPADEAQDNPAQDEEPEAIIVPSQAIGYSGPFLMREGASVAGAVGTLVRHEDGYWIFHVEPEDANRQPIDLIVLPSRTLARMEQIVEQAEVAPTFEVTGTVYVFDQENYLLPLASPRIVEYAEDGSEEPQALPDDVAPSDDRERPTSDLSAEEIIAAIRRDVPVARSLVVEGGLDDSDAAGDESALDDGALIMSRRGRIARTPEGGWRFTFAADAAGLGDPPMILLPCLALEGLRDRVEQNGAQQVFLITGQVFTYHGERFLLPTMFRAEDVAKNPNIQR